MKPPGDLVANATHYSKTMATFHWLTAVLVIVAYLISESSPDIRKDPPIIHILLGLSVLTLTLPSLTNYAHAYRNGPRISSAPADVLDRRRRAPAASGMLRSTRRQIGRPIPRAVSEISPHIAGAGIARFVTVQPQP
jgi:hypothetical protein